MGNGDEINEEEEQRLIRIIKRIKNNRNKACYQNILAFALREDKDATMENIKVTINNLLHRNIITNTNNGKIDMESFKLVADENLETLEAETQVDTNCKSLENFINLKFYETLVDKIKDEVKNAINESSLLKANTNSINVISPECENEANSKKNNDLVNVLLDQIEFLKGELKSKDSIIKLLLSDRVTSINTEKLKGVTCNYNTNISRNVESNGQGKVEQNNNRDDICLDKDQNCEFDNGDDNGIKKGETKSINVNKNKQRSTTIIGDSLLKDLEPRKMREAMGRLEKVFIKSFSGANIEAMEHYVKPTMNYNNDLIVLHFGTNDLRSEKSANDIANGIVKIGIKMKTEANDVMISSIVPRADNEHLDKKASQVNEILSELCHIYNFHLINNCSILKERHLNSSGLHLNMKGTYALANNLLNAIRL